MHPQSEIIDEIRAWHRKRCFLMERRKGSVTQLKAGLRTALGWSLALPAADRKSIEKQAAELVDNPGDSEWADVIAAVAVECAPFDAIEKKATKEMERLAKLLPAWAEFGEGVRGFGAGSLAVIVAEAGDLSNYSTVAKLWKRMGLAVFDGVRQGGLTKGTSKEEWIAHGYSPMRRSRMWNIGEALKKLNQDGPYRAAYLARKQYERARAEASGLTVAPAAEIPAKRRDEFMSLGHIDHRAQRYMEKRLLKHLWQAWRRAIIVVSEKTEHSVPAVEIQLPRKRQRRAIQGMSEKTTAQLPAAEIASEERASMYLTETSLGPVPARKRQRGATDVVSEKTTDPMPAASGEANGRVPARARRELPPASIQLPRKRQRRAEAMVSEKTKLELPAAPIRVVP